MGSTVGLGDSWDFIYIGGIGHDDLATNKFVETRTVFGQGVSSLVGGMANVAGATVFGCCCSTRGLLWLGVNGPSLS